MTKPIDTRRRHALRALGAALAVGPVGAALGCGSSGGTASPTAPSSASTSTQTTTTTTTPPPVSTGACVEAAAETRGPYPDALGMINNPAFYRQDIREGRSGLPVTLVLSVVNTRQACAPVANAAIEIWQCDADGHYSEYAQPGYNGTGQTFLRGLQVTNDAGTATFTTIYPGWYAGRATHIHVDVSVSGRRVKETQIAFPEDVTRQVYSSGVYASKGQNPTTNARDNVFSDGTTTEMATLSGSVSSGYTASLTVGVAL